MCVSLAGVDAPEGGWCTDAERCIAKLVAGQKLKATVVTANKFSAHLYVVTEDGVDIG